MAFGNGVEGTAEGAYQLAAEMKSTIVDVWRSCEMIGKSCNSLREYWDDEGVDEAEETITQINRAIKNRSEDFGTVYKAVLAYADFLSRH